MLKPLRVCALVLCFTVHVCQGRDHLRTQNNNPNSDFLLHEAGQPTIGKPSTNAPSGPQKNFQASDFPELKPASNNRDIPKSPNSDKRDYVAPQWTTPKTQASTGKRDFVAPQWTTPSSKATQQSTKPTVPSAPSSPTATQSPKRDFVSPNVPSSPHSTKKPEHSDFPPLKPIGFTTPKTQGSTGKRDYVAPNWPALPNQPTSSQATMITKKPISFSSVVAGTNKPGATSSPPTAGHHYKHPSSVKPQITTPSVPTKTPGSPALPSSILNNNKNTNTAKNGITDLELQALSEDLLRKDTNNAAKLITVNIQEKTTSGSKEDKAPHPLLVIPDSVWNMPTIQKFLPLLDNYEWDTIVNEHITPQERTEENAFMDVIMTTSVIRHLMSFLREKGIVTPDPKQQRDYLKQLWFTLYSRGKGKIGSSGFEHIFVSELKNGLVSGLHNWIYFAREEAKNGVNYYGYMKNLQLNDKGSVLKLHFTQQGYDKPVDTMFIGTSPELEMALYTLCFVTRADQDCRLKLAGKDVNIVSHTFRYRSKNLIGSAFPEI